LEFLERSDLERILEIDWDVFEAEEERCFALFSQSVGNMAYLSGFPRTRFRQNNNPIVLIEVRPAKTLSESSVDFIIVAPTRVF
jgi:hypothetical protein